jgi:hypothetical protein
LIAVWDWLVQVSGARDEGGAWYGLWSGFGGAIPDVALLAAVAGWYWHHTCHVSACWRPGRHAVDGTAYRTCRRHHPGALPRRVTARHIEQSARQLP